MRNKQRTYEFLIGFGIGLLFSGVAVALLSELKFLVERHRLKGITEAIHVFDEDFSGDIIQPLGRLVLEEMSGRVRAEENAVKERRLFREGVEEESFEGVGGSSVYYEEE